MAKDKYQGFGLYLCEPEKKLLNWFVFWFLFYFYIHLRQTHAFFHHCSIQRTQKLFLTKNAVQADLFRGNLKKKTDIYLSNFNSKSTQKHFKRYHGNHIKGFLKYQAKKTKTTSQKN